MDSLTIDPRRWGVWARGAVALPRAASRDSSLRIPATPRQRRAPPRQLLQLLAQPAAPVGQAAHFPAWEG
jgi:hypothetical protein